MKINCPHCSKEITVYGLGRKRLDVPVKNIYDKLSLGKSIPEVAVELGCSRAYIYQRLKEAKHERNN